MESSPFGRLAGERRNQIYELVLHPSEGIEVDLDRESTHNELLPTPNRVFALTTTCKQIRQETRAFKLSANKFCLHVGVFALPLSPTQPGVDRVRSNQRLVNEHLARWTSNMRLWYTKMIAAHRVHVQHIEFVLKGLNMNFIRDNRATVFHHMAHELATADYDTIPSPVEVTLGRDIRYPDNSTAMGSERLLYFSLPTGDITAAKVAIKKAAKGTTRELKRAWKNESLTLSGYSDRLKSLQRWRGSLERFMEAYTAVKIWS